MVRPVGVGRSRPPLGVPIEINKSGAGFFYNPTPHIQTQAPKRPLRITGKTVIIGVGAVILLCGRLELPHRGVRDGRPLRPAFIYLGVSILHHALKSCKRFFILHAELLLFLSFVVGVLLVPGHGPIAKISTCLCNAQKFGEKREIGRKREKFQLVPAMP